MKCEDLTALGEKLGNLARNSWQSIAQILIWPSATVCGIPLNCSSKFYFTFLPGESCQLYSDDIEGKPGYDH